MKVRSITKNFYFELVLKLGKIPWNDECQFLFVEIILHGTGMSKFQLFVNI